jgi:hypothetical protein
MNKTALQDIQRTLNIIRNQIDAVDAETKWAALELILASSSSIVALAKKITKPGTKTVTRTISIPKTKIVKQPVPKPANQKATKDIEPKSKAPIRPQKPLPN